MPFNINSIYADIVINFDNANVPLAFVIPSECAAYFLGIRVLRIENLFIAQSNFIVDFDNAEKHIFCRY